MKIIITASCCALLFAGSLSAQPQWQWLNQFAFNVGGGLDEPFLTTKTNLGLGWNVQGGVGYNFTRHLTVMAEIEYDQFHITNKALNTLGTPQGYPGGHLKNESITIDPMWHFHPKGAWDVYAIGGGGAFSRTQSLIRPTIATATGTNPFFGFNTPGYPSSVTALDYTVHKPGVDIGFGISVKVAWNFKLYAEAKYNHVFTGSLKNMDYMPISVGVRW
jgi:outer membrane protein with beta-barrel domain